ncbi:hypothetical protein ACFOWE_31355 [Planomonospora corallina]|uniref:Uncharacterized protein n=1 Tax=Planomonospora corallina TaxID=1806052 RepID=A0ABV8IFB7_9ACTN
MSGYHRGRSWSGHELEDGCPCPQEACGLVDLDKADPGCDQHGQSHPPRSMRQGHPAVDCPAGTDTATVLRLARDALKHGEHSCRYHGAAPPPGMCGRPGCDSCRQPIRVRKALNAFLAAGIDP